jgi:integrase
MSFGVTKLREARDKLLAEGKAPGTVNRHLSGLRAAWNWARSHGYLPTEAVWPAKLQLKEPAPRARFLSQPEAERLMTALSDRPPWFKAATIFALTTGMRQGEQLRLTWADIDMAKRRAYVMLSKTGRRRAVHVPEVAISELRNIGPGDPDARVFPYSDGNVNRLWKLTRKEAGIENCRWHDLRHSCASWLAQNGASLMQVAEQLGHTSLAATKRYAFLIEGEETPAHTAFERLRR